MGPPSPRGGWETHVRVMDSNVPRQSEGLHIPEWAACTQVSFPLPPPLTPALHAQEPSTRTSCCVFHILTVLNRCSSCLQALTLTRATEGSWVLEASSNTPEPEQSTVLSPEPLAAEWVNWNLGPAQAAASCIIDVLPGLKDE